jgi:hypothetical protein
MALDIIAELGLEQPFLDVKYIDSASITDDQIETMRTYLSSYYLVSAYVIPVTPCGHLKLSDLSPFISITPYFP